MSSCCISVMYDPNSLLRHTTPHTLLPHCSKYPLRLFHSTCQTVIHLSLSRSLPPSLPHTCFIFTPARTSLRLIVSITLLCLRQYSYGFVFLKKGTQYCAWLTTDVSLASLYFVLPAWTSAKTKMHPANHSTARAGIKWGEEMYNSKRIKTLKVFVTFGHFAGAAPTASADTFLHWQ